MVRENISPNRAPTAKLMQVVASCPLIEENAQFVVFAQNEVPALTAKWKQDNGVHVTARVETKVIHELPVPNMEKYIEAEVVTLFNEYYHCNALNVTPCTLISEEAKEAFIKYLGVKYDGNYKPEYDRRKFIIDKGEYPLRLIEFNISVEEWKSIAEEYRIYKELGIESDFIHRVRSGVGQDYDYWTKRDLSDKLVNDKTIYLAPECCSAEKDGGLTWSFFWSNYDNPYCLLGHGNLKGMPPRIQVKDSLMEIRDGKLFVGIEIDNLHYSYELELLDKIKDEQQREVMTNELEANRPRLVVQ